MPGRRQSLSAPGRHQLLYKLLAVDYGENLTVTTNSGRKKGEQNVSLAMERYTPLSKDGHFLCPRQGTKK